ncbi:hypothetical protein GCM10010435_07540 [Winogradskya consettensis]|uniref:N-acetyltransferase domain-containing protein n=1 Tax=Winogradskya consettensis TaxID=113560 RepID=A0A919SQC0_9ACTN|nr:GNAT family N-acetyltransferase [Actinoplanes consettensis]GIM75711.1 hypothetical protein Aco04nite_46700 [Actinoplanes consettensis]
MALTIEDLSEADFARRRGALVADVTDALVKAEGRTVQEAEMLAAANVGRHLPDGPATPGHLLRRAVLAGEEIGWVWVSLPGTFSPAMAWISDLVIDPPHRNHGYARSVLDLVERDLSVRGIPRVGLNVYGHNATARRLYERSGYEITNQQRARALVDIPASEGVSLVTMRDYDTRMATLVEEFAADLSQDEGLPPADAAQLARRRIAEWLPQGPETEGVQLRTVVAEGVEVGWVWSGVSQRSPGMGWLHNIEIDPAFRSRGYGSLVIAAVQQELARRGLRSIGLNVHGYNVRAMALYQRLGFEVLAQQMAKNLPAL